MASREHVSISVRWEEGEEHPSSAYLTVTRKDGWTRGAQWDLKKAPSDLERFHNESHEALAAFWDMVINEGTIF